MLTPDEWHERYLKQSTWTSPVRKYCFSQISIPRNSHVLEVGCGTGAITSSIRAEIPASVFGLDIQFPYLGIAKKHDGGSYFTCGDAFDLPYQAGVFDIVCCHYFLLWIKDPLKAMKEMVRVIRKGGYLLVLAEPDYGGRLDYPEAFVRSGYMQTLALTEQGADPYIGRRLASLMVASGLQDIQTGLIGGQWKAERSNDLDSDELNVMRNDLGDQMTQQEWAELKREDIKARENGERILFIPTFYSWGLVD
jgi:SAM-dependent methyltransferase